MTLSKHLPPISKRLQDGLQRLLLTKLDLPLVPLNNNKQPLGDSWQNRPFRADELSTALTNGGVEVPLQGELKKIPLQGFGLLTGRPINIDGTTYYLMALDQDGESAIRKILELSNGEPLPKTVAFSSGRPGRCQYLFLVPEEYKEVIRTKKVKTGFQGDDGKIEQVEFRWSNLQSVLPPSVHPTTGQYHWVSGCAIDETEIAIAPTWVIEQMLIDPALPTPPLLESLTLSSSPHNNSHKQWTDIDFALSYLNALTDNRADDYDEWLNVGMALHSVDDSLLTEWDRWSQQSSKYKPGACEKKWKSFSNHGGITLGTLAHMAKQDGWQFPIPEGHPRNGARSPKKGSVPFFSRPQKTTVTSDTSSNSDRSNQEPLSLLATVTTVTTLLKAGLKDYEERAELDAVGERSSMSKGAFWELVKAIRCELDEIQASDSQRLNQLIDWHNATLNFNQVLPKPLADAFDHDALILNIDPVSLWQYLLPTVLSLAGKRVNLDIESHLIPAILWTCIVAESGTGKTRAENIILAPIKARQYKEYERFREDVKKSKENLPQKLKDDEQPKPPAPEKKYLFEVATIQAVMRRLAEQEDNGSLWARDEIAGLFKSLKQFSKQDNEAVECLLKMWDGTGSFVERMDAENNSYSVFETRLNITGGIQPGAFRQAFKDPDDAQGLQARFLYAIPKVQSAKRVKGYCVLSELLPGLYDWLETCPRGVIKLSREADKRYTHLVEQIGQQAESSPCPPVRAWMRKLPTQLLRIALALHLLECYFDRSQSFWEIGADTLEKAVEVCRYYKSTFALVQEKVAESDSISSILLKIWDSAITQPNGVTPRDVYRSIKAIPRRAAELGRTVAAYTIDLFSQLALMGKGTVAKNGRNVRFFATCLPKNTNTSVGVGEIVNSPNLHSDPSPGSGYHNLLDLPNLNWEPTSTVGYDGFSNSEPLVESATPHLKEENPSWASLTNHVNAEPSSPSTITPHLKTENPLLESITPHLHGSPPLGVTEVTEAQNQRESGLEPSLSTELSPVTEPTPLQPIDVSASKVLENPTKLSFEIPDEHQASIAEVCHWIEQSLQEGGESLGEIMALIKGIFASVPSAGPWIWRSLSSPVKELLWQLSPDEYGWLTANNLNNSG